MTYILTLKLNNHTTNPTTDFKFEAWAKDVDGFGKIGKSLKPKETSVEIKVYSSYTSQINMLEREQPKVYFKVYLNEVLFLSTIDKVEWDFNNQGADLDVILGDAPVVEDPVPDTTTDDTTTSEPVAPTTTPAKNNTAVVYGKVQLTNGKPASGVLLKVYHQELSSAVELAVGKTGRDGDFKIEYTPKSTGTNLGLTAFDTDGTTVIGESDAVYNAPEKTEVKFTLDAIAAGSSQYKQIKAHVTPLLKGTAPESLDAKQARFLVGTSEFTEKEVTSYIEAVKTASNSSLSAEIYFGIHRTGKAITSSALLNSTPDEVEKTVRFAIEEEYVGNNVLDDLPALQNTLKAQVRNESLDEIKYGDHSLKDYLTSHGISSTRQKTLAQTYYEHKGSPDTFWESLHGATGFSNMQDVQRTKNLVNLANLTNHIPMANRVNAYGIKSVQQLAILKDAYWNYWVQNAGTPPHIEGTTTAKKKKAYILEIKDKLAQAAPTASLIGNLLQKPSFSGQSSFRTFFARNPEFEFGRDNLQDFAANKPSAFYGISNRGAFTTDLETLQRQAHIAPKKHRADAVYLQRKSNLNSAHEIVKSGAKVLDAAADKYGIDREVSTSLLEEASKKVAIIQTLLKQNTNSITPAATLDSGRSNALKTIPHWESLFGNIDFCSCQHCSSSLSPSAYFMDVMHFLQKRNAGNGKTLADALLERRPDLAYIKLDCANTNTHMPYIDLVNELLENAVLELTNAVNVGSLSTAQKKAHYSRQSTSDTAMLSALPEHLKTAAYEPLKNSARSVNLPFDLQLSEMRQWLSTIGVSRLELFERFHQGDRFSHFAIDNTLSAELLGLTPFEFELCAWSFPNGRPTAARYAYGFPQATNEHLLFSNLSSFLKKTEMTLDKLTQLLETSFINPNNQVKITEGCDLDKASIIGYSLGKTALGLFQFDRVLSATNWSISDLDAATQVFQYTYGSTTQPKINPKFLHNVSNTLRIQALLNLPTEEILTWFGPIHTKDYSWKTSQYAQLFLQKQDFGSENNAFTNHNANFNLTQHANQIKVALELETEEFQLLTAGLQSVNLEGLSRIYRYVSMARALSISIADLLDLETLLPDSPFNGTNTAETLRFILSVKEIIQSEFSLERLKVMVGLTPYASEATKEFEAFKLKLIQLKNTQKLAIPGAEDHRDQKNKLTLEDLTIKELSTLLGTKRDSTISILENLKVLDTNNIKQTLDTTLVALSNGENTVDEPLLSELLQQVKEMHEAWNPSAKEWFYLLSTSRTNSSPLNYLPMHFKKPVNAAKQFAKWSDTNRRYALKSNIITEEHSIFDFEDAIGNPTLIQEITGWTSDITDYLGHFNHDQAIVVLEKLSGINTLAQQLKITPQQLQTFTDPSIKESHLQALRAGMKNYYGENWFAKAASLRNELRNKQRDALIGFVMTHNQKIADLTDIYNEYLIDPEMGTCMQTSRLKQALSSIQLFVQRYLLNLEPDLYRPKDDHWEEWKWMKNYRVWEANQKVFLFPENWLEPEWRDDASELFEQLNSELEQQQLNEVGTTNAYKNYVNKLNELSKLKIVGFCSGNETHKELFVFAKTKGNESTSYYVRKRRNNRWGDWKKIDLDIESDFISPIFFKDKLHIYWPIYEHTGKNTQGNETFSCKLAQSEFGIEGWTPKRVYKKIITDLTGRIQRYSLNPAIGGSTLNIELLYTAYGQHPQRMGRFRILFHGEVELDLSLKPTLIYSPDLVNSNFDSNQYILNGNSSGIKFSYNRTIAGDEGRISVLEGLNRVRAYKAYNLALVHFKTQLTVLDSYSDVQYREISEDFIYQDGTQVLLFERQEGKWTPTLLDQTKHSDLNEMTIKLGVDALFTPYKASSFSDKRFETLFKQSYTEEFFESTFKDEQRDYGNKPVLEYIKRPFPVRKFGFEGEPDSIYNWELFYHIPMTIANKYLRDQQFENAQKWLHYIFDPTSTETTSPAPARYWKFKPFVELHSESDNGIPAAIQRLLDLLEGSEEGAAAYKQLEDQIKDWRENPFNPHRIAMNRVKAYQMATVMKYIDNLVEWGDQLFRRDTMESINEATQLYLLAAEILGRKPQQSKSNAKTAKSFKELNYPQAWATNALHTIENLLSTYEVEPINSNLAITQEGKFFSGQANKLEQTSPSQSEPISPSFVLEANNDYFCTPQNEKLLDYWETVADRLFKIRHCMDLTGRTRQLALFEPPIDPALLIKARAAGLSIDDVLNNLSSPKSSFRFRVLLQKALEFCNEVRGLGGALLTALEKRDAEALSALRNQNEDVLFDYMIDMQKNQLEASKSQELIAEHSKNAIKTRHVYYSNLEKISTKEQLNLDKLKRAHDYQVIGQSYDFAASIAYMIPQLHVGFPGGTSYGGLHIGNAYGVMSKMFNMLSSIESYKANRASINSSHNRRWDDWKMQELSLSHDLKRAEQEEISSAIRTDITKIEIQRTKKQRENLRKEYEFLQSKFTNKKLYDWMSGQLATLHFQAYQMAFDIARQAEKAYQFETGETTTFINYGYWDNLKKGLLAGDKLNQALRRMDKAYLEWERCPYELSKTISLRQLDPRDLIMLRRHGECYIDLPEVLFDLDYPSHYNRRIKSVSLTIPSVTGPYTSINATLTLEKSWIRRSTTSNTLSLETSKQTSIATSSGQDDSGKFQLDFRSERYLPFEGAGAISQWKLTLSNEVAAFDMDTISDVLMHINYTAKEGGDLFGSANRATLKAALLEMPANAADHDGGHAKQWQRAFSLKQEYSSEWQEWVTAIQKQNDAIGAPTNAIPLTLEVGKNQFPKLFNDLNIKIRSAVLMIIPKSSSDLTSSKIALHKPGSSAGDTQDLTSIPPRNTELKSNPILAKEVTLGSGIALESSNPQTWTLKSSDSKAGEWEDVILLLHYTIS